MMRVSAAHVPAVGGLLHTVVGISEGLDLEGILRKVTEAAREQTGARYAALGVLGPDGLHETFVHSGIDVDTVRRIGHLPEGRGVLGHITRESRTVRVDDIAAHPSAVGFPTDHPPMTTFLGVPLRVRDVVFGNLYLSEKPGGFSEADADTVQTLAAAASVAIDNARLFAGVARREAWANAAGRVTTALLRGTEEEDALAIIAEQARLVAGADLGALVLPSIDGRLIVEIAAGDDEAAAAGLVGMPLPAHLRSSEGAGPLNGWLVKDLAASVGLPAVRETGADLPPGHPRKVTGGTLASSGPAMFAPLGDGDEPLGLLLVARRAGAAVFSTDDLATATAFASQAALALRLAAARRREDVVALYEERQRIARDLHDLAVQQLFAAGLQLSRLRSAEPAPGDAEALDAVLDGIDEAVTQIRATIRSLQSHGEATATQRLREEVGRARATLGFEATLVVTPRDAGERRLEPDLVDDIGAVTREALSNIARHARASKARVHLDLTTRQVTLTVEDDGVGIGTGCDSGGRRSGLANFEVRARRHGGSVTVSRVGGTPGCSGTRVVWQVPIGPPGPVATC